MRVLIATGGPGQTEIGIRQLILLAQTTPLTPTVMTVIKNADDQAEADQVLAQTEDFFGNRMTEAEMSEFLRHHRVRWLLLGPNEHRPHSSALSKRLPGLGFRPAYLSPDGNISIYRLEIQKS